MKVKICGITNLDDAKAAVDCGADALGFIFSPKSPRFLSPVAARKIIKTLPPFIITVGVFTEGTKKDIQEAIDSCGIDMIQFHGPFTEAMIEPFYQRAIQVVPVQNAEDPARVRPLPVRAYLVDIPRTDHTLRIPFPWETVLPVKEWGNLILAGLLTPENVQEAITAVHPYAVDVCSGVEKEKGKKDYLKLKRFIEAAKWK